MNYDIKIRGDKEDNGLLEFDRLNQITQNTKEIATKALMLKIRGFSEIKPDKSIKEALAIRLQSLNGNKNEGTSMVLDCEHFEKTLKVLQLNLFKPTGEVLKLTPMALVIQTFRSALIEEEDKDNLDKPLLKTLLKFKKNFISNNEIFYFSNRNSIPEIEVTLKDFRKIENLEDSIPEPTKVIINGKLDEMKYSKSKLVLITNEGAVNAFAKDYVVIDGIVHYMGKELTISGMAHYKPNGQVSFIEIQEYYEPGKKDIFFSRKPLAMDTQQQIAFQLKAGKSRNPLTAIIGKWPGNESDDEFQKMLKDLD
ncbi:MAG: hypothetical protein A2X08_01865 [Bacteroidetes bacterium GWA2_32_17]|nr:MAG: hypothetical protein A2X08_01865 [Bacteroidetes bacterium GWA2_32_17]